MGAQIDWHQLACERQPSENQATQCNARGLIIGSLGIVRRLVQ